LGGLLKKLFSFNRINGFVSNVTATSVASAIYCYMFPTPAVKALDTVFEVFS
jgi:hypothetical protein